MESKIYSLLNDLLNPKKIPVALSVALLWFLPSILEMFLIIYLLRGLYSIHVLLTLESLSVLLGYLYAFLMVKIRIHQSLLKYREKYIFRLLGSLPAIGYLLSPGLISFFLGLFLMLPFNSIHIGRKMVRNSRVDPSVIYTLLELNNSK